MCRLALSPVLKGKLGHYPALCSLVILRDRAYTSAEFLRAPLSRRGENYVFFFLSAPYCLPNRRYLDPHKSPSLGAEAGRSKRSTDWFGKHGHSRSRCTKALDGLLYELGQEEEQIRTDPAAQTTALLKEVFGKKS